MKLFIKLLFIKFLINCFVQSVEFLSLRSCQITDAGIESISSCLGALNGGNKKLLNLNLSGNMIGDYGATQIAKVSFFQLN